MRASSIHILWAQTTTMLEDVPKTERQRHAEDEVNRFREALGPFVTAADATRMPMVFTDAGAPDHPIVYVNQAFLTLIGYEEHEVMGQSFDFLMKRGTDPEMLRRFKRHSRADATWNRWSATGARMAAWSGSSSS